MRETEIILADDMSEHPVTPQREQEISALVGDKTNSISDPIDYDIEPLRKDIHLEELNQNQLIAAPSRLQAERELERRKAIYRALMIGYTVKEDKFDNIPKAEPVRPNPRNKKPQEPLTPEQERRLARIKKNLRKR